MSDSNSAKPDVVTRMRKLYRDFLVFFVISCVADIFVTLGNTGVIPSEGAGYFDFMPVASLLFGFGLLFAAIQSLRLLYHMWRQVPAEKAQTTPGKAVGFLLIPVFRLYWYFVAYRGLATALNRSFARKGSPLAVSVGTVTFACVLAVILESLVLLIRLVPSRSALQSGCSILLVAVSLLQAVCWPLMLGILKKGASELCVLNSEQPETASETSPEQA